MAKLFEPLKIKDVTLRNRIGVSPMCQYSSVDGKATDWHMVHLGSRAVGGAGLIIAEATSVSPEGRITPHDAGLWSDDHIEPLKKINAFIKEYGSVPAVQLAHAGRKAGAARPWQGGQQLENSEGGWTPIGPTAEPFGGRQHKTPKAMNQAEIIEVQHAFRDAAVRALEAGYEMVEIHGAHGYLQHSFLSPLSNKRTDEYGGSFENRTRMMLETVRLVRAVWPERLPFAVRLSASDWDAAGWSVEDSIALSRLLKEEGVDLVDCSSGGASSNSKTALGGVKRDQIPLAAAVRDGADVLSAAVGGIIDFHQAEDIIAAGKADVVLLAREMLRDPYWPFHAAQALNVKTENVVPSQVGFWVG
ncbi:MAG: NADH:flavin oxidoreductase/NADH oxidase [Ardenticatenaceae bacterium]|nr:NADH:flavin oxidoreductase/NADH oxidase [Ardenticatenaceae bacterium]